jgi:hypothetical protein
VSDVNEPCTSKFYVKSSAHVSIDHIENDKHVAAARTSHAMRLMQVQVLVGADALQVLALLLLVREIRSLLYCRWRDQKTTITGWCIRISDNISAFQNYS